jgi:RNA polymerase sigma factor (TIGR02999 family)
MSDVTRILQAIDSGDPHGSEELLPLVYEQLRRLAAHKMSLEAPGQTLQPTALVHEAWLRLIGNENVEWKGRAHFFGAAAEAMRRILINNALRKRAIRHGGGQKRVDFEDLELAAPGKDDELLAVNEALEKFSAHSPTKADLVKLIYFVGLTVKEAADIVGVSEITAKRHWAYARAWLFAEIESTR